MPKLKITQKDIALAADVSQAVVSLVLSGGDIQIAEATRTRILETAAELGYAPRQRNAKMKAVSGNRTLAYIRPVVTREDGNEEWICRAYDEFYDQIQNHLVAAAYQKGCAVLVRPYADPKELTRWITEWGVDGVFAHFFDDELLRWIAVRHPTVQIDRGVAANADAVFSDQEQAIVMAVNHLYSRGHRKIVYIPKTPLTDYLSKLRTWAYRERLNSLGLPVYEEFLNRNPAEISDQLLDLIGGNSTDSPTAIIAGDFPCLQLIKTAISRGFSLPNDFSIVGIDNVSAGVFSHPSLTSIDHRYKDCADAAISLMLERIRDPKAAYRKVAIVPQLVVRESVMDIISDSVAIAR